MSACCYTDTLRCNDKSRTHVFIAIHFEALLGVQPGEFQHPVNALLPVPRSGHVEQVSLSLLFLSSKLELRVLYAIPLHGFGWGALATLHNVDCGETLDVHANTGSCGFEEWK